MKAILIIDVSDYFDIEQYKVHYELLNKVFIDNYARKDITYLDLKPMPQRKEIEWSDSFGKHNYKKGFNACIDEILGEQNETKNVD